ncbi:LysR substrate-binding domain-containing protein [Paenibacillus sp. IHBB 10380]|uniref:LysR substrate-binding domain-containing protein n=1 Tax=Paenibacillus sp. IHBB 10380 TaxID=1566358 RepID=UPI0009E5C27E|nr:LysR substrate-binding domain-containing protein [Paenibacillus sp. IHBB 10380]
MTQIAFLPIYPEDNHLYSQFDASILFEEEMPLIIPAGHPWASRKLLYTRDLHRETILIPQSKYICQYIQSQLKLNHVKVRYLQMSTFNMIKQSIKVGLGVSFLPYEAVKNELDNGELVTIPVSSLQIRRKNGFVIRKNTQLSAEEQAFCHKVESYFSSSVK